MFKTETINNLYESVSFLSVYEYINLNNYEECINTLDKSKTTLQETISEDELVLNDIFLLKQIVHFHYSLVGLWKEIFNMNYSNSWNKLQNCFDSLRAIKKFSFQEIHPIFDYFENQLLELEKLYPYHLFFSTGLEVELYRCSICNADIDSFECPHEIGELYMGQMASGIAENALDINHVAMVENPMDKRCVIVYDDKSDNFNVLQYLNNLLRTGKITPLTFETLKFSKKNLLNAKYILLGRNEKCFCKSGKKFKNCCIKKQYIEKDHVDIIIGNRFHTNFISSMNSNKT